MKHPLRTALALLAFGTAHSAYAQAVDPIAQRLQDDFRAEEAFNIPPGELNLTGQEDIVLLKYREFFTLSANAGATYTTNAFSSDANKTDDLVYDAGFNARFSTQIAQRYDVFASVGTGISRYEEHNALDYNSLNAQAGVETPIGPYRAGLIYNVSSAYGRDGFSDHLVTLHDLMLTGNRPYRVDADTLIIPQLVLGRTFADPHDYSVWSARFGGTVVHSLQPGLYLTAGPEVYYRAYDDFFEAATGTSRNDLGVRVSAGINWHVTDGVDLSAQTSFTNNNSSVTNSDYQAFTVAPIARLSVRF